MISCHIDPYGIEIDILLRRYRLIDYWSGFSVQESTIVYFDALVFKELTLFTTWFDLKVESDEDSGRKLGFLTFLIRLKRIDCGGIKL
ncbi:hypothetical protein L1987_63330 [Smallanthus sonchifolius]|uniref:Uncharacterized protein n=1 Tax=Smallanthus sonchifolius TaxID=185202 RepID=A0ACB9CDA6_9ASTR|nr:hypothetical protein L1987_63330 [Smallanthus sonchifolius]